MTHFSVVLLALEVIEEGERGDPCETEGSATWRAVDEMAEHYVEDVNVGGSEKNGNSSVKLEERRKVQNYC